MAGEVPPRVAPEMRLVVPPGGEEVSAIRDERGPSVREVLLGVGHEDETGGADATGENVVGIT